MAVNCVPNLRVCNNEIDEVNYGGQDKCQHGVLKVAFSDPRKGGRGVMRGREQDPGPVCTLKGDKLQTPKTRPSCDLVPYRAALYMWDSLP